MKPWEWKKESEPMNNMKRGTVTIGSRGPEGNIYYILGAVRDELQRQKRLLVYNELLERVQHSGSYGEAINIIREYVDLIDRDSKI